MSAKVSVSVFASLALIVSVSAASADTCVVKAVIGGKAVEMRHCAVAVYDEKGITLLFSETPIGNEEREAFQFNSFPEDEDASGKPRSMMHAAFCPGGGTSTASPAAVKSVELSMSHVSSPMLQRQWVFDLAKDKGLTIEKLSGTLASGGRLMGRISGARTSDGLKYSWEADFDVAMPEKGAAAGPGCGN